MMSRSAIITFVFSLIWLQLTPFAYAEDEWIVTQSGTGFQYDTQTGISSRKGISRTGLLSVSRSGSNLMQSYWQRGAHRATISFKGHTIVDGYDLTDVSRIKSFRFDKTGSTVFVKTTKGPRAIVELIQDGRRVLTWPRLSLVNVIGYRTAKLTVSIFASQSQTTEFWQYLRLPDGAIKPEGKKIGVLKGCAVLGTKLVKQGIAIEAYCDVERGSDVKFLDFESGEITDIKSTRDDELLAYSWTKYDKTTIPVLSASGNNNARHFFHAFSASLLKLLGEPMAVASDESGKQSWSQSYRTRTLAVLFEKTGHLLFSRLARQAMGHTLDQQNSKLNISGKFNPSCAWASRIYSTDGKSPVSFMINQAMISASLIKSCSQLGNRCEPRLQQRITDNASCLTKAYEKWFDRASGLYRIPHGAPFRYDGIWAPWNWQVMWSVILQHVGNATEDSILRKRAKNIISAFVDSWEITQSKKPIALWRYWPKRYYLGWHESDQISKSRPRQKPRIMANERYEDLNHAGISLLGLTDSDHNLSEQHQQIVDNTARSLLQRGSLLPRDMDGNGPASPRWLPGAGWHRFAPIMMSDRYAHKLPGGASSDQHLAYAFLFKANEKFDLKLKISQCNLEGCTAKKQWFYRSSEKFLSNNPFVQIERK